MKGFVRIAEKTEAYIFADVDVTDEELAELRAMSREELEQWNAKVQSERDLTWFDAGNGDDYETIMIRVGDDYHEVLWEEA